MITYPKINSLYIRDMSNKGAFTDEYAHESFPLINKWHVEEKIDGTNIRFSFDKSTVEFGGRTDRASIPTELMGYLKETFTIEKLKSVFPNAEPNSITLFGEGYGGNIQAGSYYSAEQRFTLFDVKIGKYWLKRTDVYSIASNLGVSSPTNLGYMDTLTIEFYIKRKPMSVFAKEEHVMEGIIARTDLLDRKGDRVMFKLKVKDFN